MPAESEQVPLEPSEALAKMRERIDARFRHYTALFVEWRELEHTDHDRDRMPCVKCVRREDAMRRMAKLLE